MTYLKRKQNRVKGYNYSIPGAYFVTICTDKRRCLFSRVVGALHEAPLQRRSVLSKIIGYLKMNVSKEIHTICPGEKIWQRSFYDHIIRNDQDYQETWQYIENNPRKWWLKQKGL